MNHEGIEHISIKTGISTKQVGAVARLLEEGATIPFIARYRKEATGELDEVQIALIRDTGETWTELEKRRSAVLKSLEERELLSPELKESVSRAETMTELEDIYLPFRPKKKTRGSAAREAGLEPLAEWLLNKASGGSLEAPLKGPGGKGAGSGAVLSEAVKYTNPEKGIQTDREALEGARDILAEVFNENTILRRELRKIFNSKALLESKSVSGKEEEGAKYRDYFAWSEPAEKAPSHRILAVLRGTGEGFLSSRFRPPEEEILPYLVSAVTGGKSSAGAVKNRVKGSALDWVIEAVEDGYRRLTAPSLETELRNHLRDRAGTQAIDVFAGNLRELLLASPLGSKRTLAVDPGLRTGCKIVCLDSRGELMEHTVIYPLPPHSKTDQSRKILRELCGKYDIEAVAVGNGTGGREAETFVRDALEDLPSGDGRASGSTGIPVIMVNESGASVYSASAAAREEFPDEDVTVRGAVSIGRRLMDPLAELVKIDPKSIGVGQYQHDVDQKQLKKALDDVVLSCVNGVGVELNTASVRLLSYVSGISDRTAKAIITRRKESGDFRNREELKKVSGLGPKAFEQCAGFIRIRGGNNPLDSSAVHPESYPVVEKMASDLGSSSIELMENPELRKKINIKNYITDKTGLPTLKDIMAELEKPGRDPRPSFEVFSFALDVHVPEDLREGMVLPGIVTNVTAFGAFVDVGVHQDGLVHISQISDSFVKDPADILKTGMKVKVKVLDVDLKRKRIGLSMKGLGRSK